MVGYNFNNKYVSEYFIGTTYVKQINYNNTRYIIGVIPNYISYGIAKGVDIDYAVLSYFGNQVIEGDHINFSSNE